MDTVFIIDTVQAITDVAERLAIVEAISITIIVVAFFVFIHKFATKSTN